MGEFENSSLGKAIGLQRQQINNFINQGLNNVKQISQKADKKVSQLKAQKAKQNDYDFRLRAKYGSMYDPNKVKQRQQELVNNGYKIAVDGDWGKQCEAAWKDYKKKKRQILQDAEGYQYTPKQKSTIYTKISDLIYGTPEEIEKETRMAQNSYANSRPWRYQDDVYSPFDKDLRGHKVGNSRMGDLGLTSNGGGTYCLYDPKQGKITQCAKTANMIERTLGPHKTDGNAWNRRGIYGDSTIFNGYKYLPKIGSYNKITHTLQNLAAAAAVQANFNNIDFQQGDIIDLYSANSAHNDEAWNEGTLNRSNSHTGVLYQPRPGYKKGTYILHNVNGTVYLDPISKFMVSEQGPKLDWAITGVHRPGTKEHPYKDKNGNYTSK